MSIKRPLCNYSGVVKELDAADLLVSEKVAVRITADGSSVQSMASAAFTRIAGVFKTVVSDPLSWWSVATHKFTPTKPGYYLLNVTCELVALSTGATAIYIFKNGTPYMGGTGIAQTKAILLAPLYMNGSTDYIEFYFYNGDSIARNTTSSAVNNVIDILYLG